MKAVKEIPQEIDVELSTDEDVDEMILETEVGGDFKQLFPWSESQNEPESDAVTDRHGVPPEDVSHRDSGGGTAQDQDGCKVHGGWWFLFSREAGVEGDGWRVLLEKFERNSEPVLRDVKILTQKAPTSVSWRGTRCVVVCEKSDVASVEN